MTNPFPTDLTDPNAKKLYNATAWARPNEELTFHVKFGEGSHIGVNFSIVEVFPNNNNPDDIVADECETAANGGFPAPVGECAHDLAIKCGIISRFNN